MKKILIGGLVGSIILFVWQFLSWAALGLHYDQMAYTPNQDQVIEAINSLGLEEGDYFVPQAKPGSSAEEIAAMQEKYLGKPWAKVTYRKTLENNMAVNMFRGWSVTFIATLLFCWLLGNYREIKYSNAITSALAVGLIGYFINPYLNAIWFEGNSMPDLIDAIVPWALFGVFMGWFSNR
jgi:hypothetical protein